MGRPRKYNQTVADRICDRLAAGESLRKICADKDMPSQPTVYSWALRDEQGFFKQYARAREIQLETMIDEIMDWCDQALENPALTQAMRLKVDSLKWIASKKLPKKYGDKIEHEHTGDIEHKHFVVALPQEKSPDEFNAGNSVDSTAAPGTGA